MAVFIAERLNGAGGVEGHVSDRPHEPIVSTGSDHIKAVLAASIKPGPAPIRRRDENTGTEHEPGEMGR
jgi:hypothetical protein